MALSSGPFTTAPEYEIPGTAGVDPLAPPDVPVSLPHDASVIAEISAIGEV